MRHKNHEVRFRVWDNLYNRWATQINLASAFNGVSVLDGIDAWTTNLWSFNPKGFPDHHIIQQFTGMCDISGRNIYDGDICRIDLSYNESMGGQLGPVISVINYEFGCYYFGGDQLNEFITSEMNAVQNIPIVDMTVIGNILETPELITV